MPDNRTKLIYAALKLFAAYGYDAVGVQQIVEEVGVTKPTLYHYFQSKLGLFEALIEHKSVNLLVELKQATDYQHDLVKSVTDVVRCYFAFLEQEPLFYRLMLATWFLPPSSEIITAVSDFHKQQYTLIEALFLQAADDHGNMRGRHKQYAVSLRGMIDTYVGLSLQGYVNVHDEQMIYRIVHQYLHGIYS